MLWTIPAASAIHLAVTNHGKFITLVAGEQPSLLMAGSNDEVCDHKPQRYTEDNNVNNNIQDNVNGAVIMAEPLREFTRFIWWM